jgi:hypothetical protein
MLVSHARPAEDGSRPGRPSCGQPPCPVCGGALVPLRGQFRCTRCFFSACAGCEAEGVAEPAEGGD